MNRKWCCLVLVDRIPVVVVVVRSPAFSAEDQQAALAKVLAKAKISGLVANFVNVVASNRRLFVLPDMIRAFRAKLADARGEITAEVAVAAKLNWNTYLEYNSPLATSS